MWKYNLKFVSVLTQRTIYLKSKTQSDRLRENYFGSLHLHSEMIGTRCHYQLHTVRSQELGMSFLCHDQLLQELLPLDESADQLLGAVGGIQNQALVSVEDWGEFETRLDHLHLVYWGWEGRLTCRRTTNQSIEPLRELQIADQIIIIFTNSVFEIKNAFWRIITPVHDKMYISKRVAHDKMYISTRVVHDCCTW